MRFTRRMAVRSFFVAALAGLAFAQGGSWAQTGSGAPPEPMAAFGRMEAGEWHLGTVQTDTWRWGPGKHSMSTITVGVDGKGDPWSELVVYYWHPALKRVCLLGFHPDIPGIGRGVASGTMVFGDEAATATFSLYQTGNRSGDPRRLRSRLAFDGPDRYQEVLSEDGGAGFNPLAEWDYTRSPERNAGEPGRPDKPLQMSKNMAPFESLFGDWRAQGEKGSERVEGLRSSFEWVKLLDVVVVRVVRDPDADGAVPLLDAYVYHNLGSATLKCLALSADGAVYEGDVSVLGNAAFELDLTRSEKGGRSLYRVRFDAGSDGTLRQRVWTVAGGERTLVLDVSHDRVDAEMDETVPPEVAPEG